jgi:hypothetical protein
MREKKLYKTIPALVDHPAHQLNTICHFHLSSGQGELPDLLNFFSWKKEVKGGSLCLSLCVADFTKLQTLTVSSVLEPSRRSRFILSPSPLESATTRDGGFPICLIQRIIVVRITAKPWENRSLCYLIVLWWILLKTRKRTRTRTS